MKTGAKTLGMREGKHFHEVLEQVLGLGNINREKFFEIIKDMQKKKLSSQEFNRLLEIIAQQEQKPCNLS